MSQALEHPAPMPRCAYLGPPGTYSHQVSLELLGSGAELVPCPTITAAVDFTSISDERAAAASHSICYALVPYENSTYGPVGETVLQLLKSPHPSFPLRIVAETRLPVGHALLVGQRTYEALRAKGKAGEDDSEPGLDDESLRGIQVVRSHEQALGQCRDFISTRLPLASDISNSGVNSTALAAQLALEDDERLASSPSSALLTSAIASTICAQVHGLRIARRNIQDRNDNTTRFLQLSCSPRSDPLTVSRLLSQGSNKDASPYHARALLLVHDDPGRRPSALSIALEALHSSSHSAVRVSLRKLDRRPTPQRSTDPSPSASAIAEQGSDGSWRSEYLIELEASSDGTQQSAEALTAALREVAARIAGALDSEARHQQDEGKNLLTVLGIWPVYSRDNR